MSTHRKRFVIVGNGGAALSALRAIRSVDRTSSITLLSSEDCFAYSPVATPYYIAGKIDRDRLFITDEAFYRRNDVRVLLKTKVLRIDPEKTSVFVEGSKETIPFDALLVATGATPVLPPGAGGKRVFSLRTLTDAERILSALPSSGDAVILGGGLVGLQLCQTLWWKGLRVTVVVGSDRILSRNVDPDASRIIRKEMEARGIGFRFHAEAASFETGGSRVRLRLSTGETLSSLLVLCGKGVRPNLLQGALFSDADAAVDERMRTRVENIYAAGDVSLIRHAVSGRWEHLSNWPNACAQGRVAGLNMAGADAMLGGLVNQNVTQLFGLRVAGIGLFDSPPGTGTETVASSLNGDKTYRRIFLREGKIVGAVLVNGIEDAGVIRNLIVRGIEVPGEKTSAADLRSLYFRTIPRR